MSLSMIPNPSVPGMRGINPLVRANALYAEYSIGQAERDGLWVAVCSVRDRHSNHVPPAWILVGTGESPDAAVDDLRTRLEQEEARLARVARY